MLLLQALDQDDGSLALDTKRIGGPLLFGRLWQELGIGEVLDELLAARGFGFAVERAVFVATLHRLFVSGSDRDCTSWMADYELAGAAPIALHHFYRPMAWLWEQLAPSDQGALAPRCVKDLAEERLFERRRDLFTDLSVVFMDTISLWFEGEGGQSRGEYGYSKDFRPDLQQMILGLVMDGAGWPVCTETCPGNTADVTVLLPIVERLRRRFGIGRVCVVGDRGMISTEIMPGSRRAGSTTSWGHAYRDLVRVEDLFRRAEAVMRTRSIFHSCDAAIRGHAFCSFLALLLQKRLDDLAQSAGVTLEWKTLLRDFDGLRHLRIRHHDADWLVRTDASPDLSAVFRTAKIALPPRVKPVAPPPTTPPPKPSGKRRGRPSRSATAAGIPPEAS